MSKKTVKLNMLPKFDRNIPYDHLPLLPPEINIWNDPEIVKKLVVASRALAAVNTNILRLPNPYMLVNTIALQEAKTSVEIENIFTTEDELYMAISDSVQERNADMSTKEVLRYREALWAGYEELQRKNKIDNATILSVFQTVKNTQTSYRPPHALVVIKRGASEFKPGEVVYTPPRAKGVIEKLIKNLLDYLNDDKKYPEDPLLKMCVAHYQFEAIHPFQDGNGRTGRVLNLLYLINKGLISHPVLYLSKYIIAHKEDYYHNLGAVTQRKSWKKWILYMLDAVEKTSSITNELIDEIVKQMESTLVYGKQEIKWYNKEINETLFWQPYIKPSVIANVIGKSSRTTLTKYMSELVDKGILSYKKNGKEVFYLNDNLIRILEG
jgi:Fic family protein